MDKTVRDIYCEEDLNRIMEERSKKKRFFRYRSKHADDVVCMGEPDRVLTKQERYDRVVKYYAYDANICIAET